MRFLIRMLNLKSLKQAGRAFRDVYPDEEIRPETRKLIAEIIAEEAS